MADGWPALEIPINLEFCVNLLRKLSRVMWHDTTLSINVLYEPDASTLDAKWQRKVQVNGQSRIVTKCEPIKIGDVISCPTWGPRAHRYASPQVVASDWLLLQIVP